MGSKFEIYVFNIDAGGWREYWRGESWIKAIWLLVRVPKGDFGCVKLEVR